MNIFYLTTTPTEVIEFFSVENLKNIRNGFLAGVQLYAWKLILAIIIWFIGKKLIQLGVKIMNKALSRTGLDTGVVKFLCSLTRFAAYIIILIQIIKILGFETTTFVALLGTAGLAFGLALQGSLSNFAGGVLILIFKPFRVDDYIVSGVNEGTVKVIDLLYTKLLTLDNKTITIPNGTLANSSVINVCSQDTRRIDIEIPIGYTSDIKKAKGLLHDILVDQPQIFKDQEITVIVKSLEDSRVLLETRAWVNTSNYWDTKCELLERFLEVFNDNGIEIPFNKMDINLKKESDVII